MATQWRPTNSSDDEDVDLIPPPMPTKDLLEKIYSETAANPLEADNQRNIVQSLSRPPVRVQEDSSTDNEPLPDSVVETLGSTGCSSEEFPTASSTDSFVEMLRSSGISSEVRDSRKVQWHRQKIIENPDLPSGCLVAGTKDLYLDDDFVVFRDSNGELLRPTIMPPPPVTTVVPSEKSAEIDPPAPIAIHGATPKSKKVKSSKPVGQTTKKTPVKGKRTAWKKIDIDVMSKDHIVPGPPEEKGCSGRNRF